MQVKLTIIKDNGEEMSYSREVGQLDSTNILNSVESEVLKMQSAMSAFLSKSFIEDHQDGFVGGKNQEKERDSGS
jgi:hypothetical protein